MASRHVRRRCRRHTPHLIEAFGGHNVTAGGTEPSRLPYSYSAARDRGAVCVTAPKLPAFRVAGWGRDRTGINASVRRRGLGLDVHAGLRHIHMIGGSGLKHPMAQWQYEMAHEPHVPPTVVP